MKTTQINASDKWDSETQAVANLCQYVYEHIGIIPLSTEGMVALMLEHRPRGVPKDRAHKITLGNQRADWKIAWQGCKALKRGQVTVESVLV